MGRSRSIPDTVRQAIKRDLRAGAPVKEVVATHKVSRGTVVRIQAEMKQGDRTEQLRGAIAALSEDVDISPADFQAVMLRLIGVLTDEDDLKNSKIGSREGAARAAVSVIDTFRRLYPPTMEEAADWLVELPGFTPGKFAAILRERYGKTG